jgi:CelD/BcsL family acetyltransferase involved in cellulose biosynthesis
MTMSAKLKLELHSMLQESQSASLHIAQAGQHPEIGEEVAECAVTVAETEAEFDVLEKPWNDLIEKCDASVFQTFEWQRTWWKYFCHGRRLRILIFKQGERLIGIAPMFLEDITLAGIRIATRLQFVGAELSDYLQFIIAGDKETVVFRAFVGYLQTTSGEWDVLDLRDLSEGSLLLRGLPAVLDASRFRVYTATRAVCPRVVLPGSWEEFVSGLNANMRHNLKRKKMRMEKEFIAEVEIFRNGDDDIRMAIDEFVALHTHRWKSLGYPSAFDLPEWAGFHLEVAQKFARRGWLRMFFLKVDGTRVATSFDFNFHNHIYVYLSHAHGPEEIMKFSPGFQLRCEAIHRGIAEGMKVYDYLRGNEKYKYQEFKCESKQNWLIRTGSPSPGGRLRYRIFRFGEFFIRSRQRIVMEYYYVKRHRLEHGDSFLELLKYVMLRCWRGLLYSVLLIWGNSSPD